LPIDFLRELCDKEGFRGVLPILEPSRMIFLTRKKGESIVINDDIVVLVVEIRADKVRLGIEAPKAVPVHSGEVARALRQAAPETQAGG